MEDPIIKINVGGKLFSAYKSTLCSKPGTFLSQKFAHSDFFTNSEEFFLDRDPSIFEIILNYYRTGILSLPPKDKLRLFYHELDFYGIDHKESFPEIAIKNDSHEDLSFQRPVWKKEYDLYVERFIRFFNLNNGYAEGFELPFEHILIAWNTINKYLWNNEELDLHLDIGMSGAENLKDLIAKYKVHNGSLQRPEDCVDGDIYDTWVKSLKFGEEEVQEILDKITNFHEIGFNKLVQKEIVVNLIKSGWKAKLVEKKIRCGTSNVLITDFSQNNIFFDGLCDTCLKVFLRDPTKISRGSCKDESDCSVLVVDL